MPLEYCIGEAREPYSFFGQCGGVEYIETFGAQVTCFFKGTECLGEDRWAGEEEGQK